MGSYEKALAKLKSGSQLRFDEGRLICERNFGKATIKGSHHKYNTGWADDPTVNIQSFKGKMKPYQQKQLLSKIIRKENDER